MSGTSIDAVDGVLARFEGVEASAPATTLAFESTPIPPALRAELLALQSSGPDELGRAALAANALADLYATVARRLIAAAPGGPDAVAAIGAHGQTVRHRPELGYTIQLLNGARLAEATGVTVACDFRSADIAVGGQGAPLVPAFHAHAFGAAATGRAAIVNIGGFANVTLLEPDGTVTGHDTGPGNVLMDAWCERHTGRPYDADGAWAASGKVLPALLDRMLADPFFALPPPKSTGRDHFDLHWLEGMIGEAGGAVPGRAPGGPAADIQATLCELTARTIADACRAARVDRIWVCGGGAFNGHLMARIRALAEPASVDSTAALGIAPQSVEALAFAWLARERLAGRPSSLPAVTGAREPRVLGAVHVGRRTGSSATR